MNESPFEQIIKIALMKKQYLQSSLVQYIIRAALSGVYVGFGVMLSFRLGEMFADAKSPATSLITGLFFGIALVLIIYGGAELFTGNTMTFTMSTLKGATSWKDAFENWLACYTGNLIGAVFFASVIMATGLFNNPDNTQLLIGLVEGKINTPSAQLFFRAVLCNWLVCLAVWIPLHLKGDGAKIVVMMLFVFAFVASGYEHSVANMVLFSISLAVPHPEAISLTGALHNLLPVTLGNIVGGGGFVGALYVYLSSKRKVKVPQKELYLVEKELSNLKIDQSN
ncbi:MAG TPA: formate/nitrite transporter family protein [Bacillus sp. (in: firmicutes)]|nr:formate/nitrite transporter family protein [Bacillus sp. (in: firmicutes)]